MEKTRLKIDDLARMWRISKSQILKTVEQPDFPKPIINKSGRAPIWAAKDVEDWLDRKATESQQP
jgi:predicted DNA-binding transcriptional regulator AlpA